jgi:uncharacterized protein YbjT (DUF2867 family)
MPLIVDRPSVLVAGATGLVGRQLIAQLLADRHTGIVHALVRREVHDLPETPTLLHHRLDLTKPLALPVARVAYIALGTTIKMAGSQEAFAANDRDAVERIAAAAKQAGVVRLAVVSALGADVKSAVFYNRVKGEMEERLAALGFERLVIARPSLLAGHREALAQPIRWGERIALTLLAPVDRLLPVRLRPIAANVVARAMRRALRADGPPVQVIESAELQSLGKARS